MYTFALLKTTKMNYRKEHIIYTLLWIVLYLSPVMSMYMRMSTNPHIDFSWEEILNAWKFNTVWVVLFSIHNFLLAPILIIKRRTWLYTALAMSLLAITMCTLYVMRPDHRMRHPKSLPPTECKQCNTDKECPECEYDRPYSNDPERRKPEMRLFSPMPLFGPGEMVAVFGGLLLMGMNLGVKLYFRSQEATEALTQIEKHTLERQLQYPCRHRPRACQGIDCGTVETDALRAVRGKQQAHTTLARGAVSTQLRSAYVHAL